MNEPSNKLIESTGMNVPANIREDTQVIQNIFDEAREKFKKISRKPTPKKYVSSLEGYEYIKRHYMRNRLNEEYPVWNMEILDWKFVGIPKSEWVVVHIRLYFLDDSGITRHCDMLDSHRIQHLTEKDSVTGNKKKLDEFVNVGNDVKAAVTDAFKKCVNFATGIGDDIYRFIDEELPPEYKSLLHKLADLAKHSGALKALEQGAIDMTNIRVSLRKVLNELSEKQIEELNDNDKSLIKQIFGEEDG